MTRFTEIVLPDELAAAARAGDMAALGAVYEACAGAAYTLIRRLVQRQAVAEDLLQDTFADVLQHIGQWQGRAPLPMWIRSIALRRSLMYLRSPWHRSLEWLETRASVEPVDPGHELRFGRQRDLECALLTLSPLARAVVWLHDVEGLTHDEIAAQMGRTTSFSKSQLARAHARLRLALVDDTPPTVRPMTQEDVSCPNLPTP